MRNADTEMILNEVLGNLKEIKYLLNNIKLGNKDLNFPSRLKHYAIAIEYGVNDLINLTEEELNDNN